MNKEELIEFLKNNLKISIDDKTDYDGDLNVEVIIKLGEEKITSDSFFIYFPTQGR